MNVCYLASELNSCLGKRPKLKLVLYMKATESDYSTHPIDLKQHCNGCIHNRLQDTDSMFRLTNLPFDYQVCY